ncbi:Triosephosphate isomerase [Candidatus Syntrophocurvum alkaliphilum]|uniref:Triosephosphate isomerase n=2 Tax=Candidatus Syntrophocurvum alkaliphilum TaxID=2293317 RepID=A0A6I6DCG3_9FIRM|nr:Triosephosphate isomerase [Candidatus Syntrophocurvum alkaliphilum]
MLAGNWKMHKTIAEGKQFINEFLPLVTNETTKDIVLCPTFTSLHVLSNELKGTNVELGAQNVFWEEKGAYTGEISPVMLKDVGCNWVIIGHSERRTVLAENDLTINRKLKAALDTELIPIFCVGETLQERENNRALEVVKEQLTNGLKDLDIKQNGIVIAYEPVWAIGTGINASCTDAQEMIGYIREYLGKIFNEDFAKTIRILYGGSVKPENIAEFMNKEDIDGALVGGASLTPDTFADIVRFDKNV